MRRAPPYRVRCDADRRIDPPPSPTCSTQQGYLADEGLATAAYLAHADAPPAVLRGRRRGRQDRARRTRWPGCSAPPLIRLQCYEGLDAAQALYDWDFPRQLLHLRAAEAAGRSRTPTGSSPSSTTGGSWWPGRCCRRWRRRPSVLLVDEVDRADDEFEAFLLEVLSDWTISVPELGTIRAETPPVVVVTSNRTREVHDALKRRCLYHWLEHPDLEPRGRDHPAPAARRPPRPSPRPSPGSPRAARSEDLLKPPGVAESLDWTEALLALGAHDLGPTTSTGPAPASAPS